MSHPIELLVRRLVDTYRRGERDEAARLFAREVILHMVRVMPPDGGSAWQRVVADEVAGELIYETRVFEDDPAAAQTFFSRADGAA